MDFITGLPRSHMKHDLIFVIVDQMTKSTNFLPVQTTFSAEDYVRWYIQEIVRSHGVLVISERFGIKWKFEYYFSSSGRWSSIEYDSNFRGYVKGVFINSKRNLDDHLPLIELLTTTVITLGSRWILLKIFSREDVHLLLEGLRSSMG